MDDGGALELGEGDLPAPSTPRSARAVAEEGSPERTPGPGEGSPIDAPDTDLLLEASARSSRRAAALRGVLEGLRITRVPPPLPGHMRRQIAGRRPSSDQALDDDMASSWASEGLERAPPTDARNEEEPRRVPPQMPLPGGGGAPPNEYPWSTWGSDDFAQTPPAVSAEEPDPNYTAFEHPEESYRIQALEAREALGRCEAERSLREGQAAKREADLRNEIILLRSGQSRERERLRGEAKRLQTSLKDAHSRLKAESEAKAAAAAQASQLAARLADAEAKLEQLPALRRETMNLRQALVAARAESKLQVAAARRTEEAHAELRQSERTQRAVTEAAEKAGLHAQPGCAQQEEPQEPEEFKEPRERLERTGMAAMRTEARSRVRHAETRQRTLFQELRAEKEARASASETYEEELQQMQLRLAALQRAKEASERYVEEEEDAWIRSQKALRKAEAQAAEVSGTLSRSEAEAAAATQDAVLALAAQQAAEAGRRRLEAELSDLRERVGEVSARPSALRPPRMHRKLAAQSVRTPGNLKLACLYLHSVDDSKGGDQPFKAYFLGVQSKPLDELYLERLHPSLRAMFARHPESDPGVLPDAEGDVGTRGVPRMCTPKQATAKPFKMVQSLKKLKGPSAEVPVRSRENPASDR
ncbi:SAMS2 [Symbiodinium natans]|uniref:SAMS2 protein n=1 Tax=Symbiodinium natans TaxID=878477 RepID=A0A812RJ25_9DINO|nr:SAMS2 [Symbiodinium natans]